MERFGEFSGFTKEERAGIRFVVSDVDDTLTNDGLLYPEALSALYGIRESGRKTILVTGGSAGWADIYIRQWPVDAVIAESGALMLTKVDGKVVYDTNPLVAGDGTFFDRRKRVMEANSELAFSSDQYCRLYDIAYDRNGLDEKQLARLVDSAAEEGGHVLVSSIHANVLMGDYAKGSSLRDFYPILEERIGLDIPFDEFLSSSIAFGDGLNDQELFALFPRSVGNARVAKYRNDFSCLPLYLCSKEGGFAFAHVIADLVRRDHVL